MPKFNQSKPSEFAGPKNPNSQTKSMSILDDTPLENGTTYYENEVLDFDPEKQRYLIRCIRYGDLTGRWLPLASFEKSHADFLCTGLNLTTVHRGTADNTRFYRRKERNLDDA